MSGSHTGFHNPSPEEIAKFGAKQRVDSNEATTEGAIITEQAFTDFVDRSIDAALNGYDSNITEVVQVTDPEEVAQAIKTLIGATVIATAAATRKFIEGQGE